MIEILVGYLFRQRLNRNSYTNHYRKKFLDGNEVEIKDRSTNEYIPVSSQSCMETVLKML